MHREGGGVMGDMKYATVSVPFNEEFYEEMLIQYFHREPRL
jgi:hypothetical protein